MRDRRRFLQLSVGAVVVGCGSGDGGVAGAKGPVAGGNASDYKSGDLRAVGGKPVAVGRDDAGFFALTTICTHEACNIASTGTITSAGLKCGCHNSTFDRTGRRTGGPASSDLEHYKVEIATDGAITVQAGDVVAATLRVAAPS